MWGYSLLITTRVVNKNARPATGDGGRDTLLLARDHFQMTASCLLTVYTRYWNATCKNVNCGKVITVRYEKKVHPSFLPPTPPPLLFPSSSRRCHAYAFRMQMMFSSISWPSQLTAPERRPGAGCPAPTGGAQAMARPPMWAPRPRQRQTDKNNIEWRRKTSPSISRRALPPTSEVTWHGLVSFRIKRGRHRIIHERGINNCAFKTLKTVSQLT